MWRKGSPRSAVTNTGLKKEPRGGGPSGTRRGGEGWEAPTSHCYFGPSPLRLFVSTRAWEPRRMRRRRTWKTRRRPATMHPSRLLHPRVEKTSEISFISKPQQPEAQHQLSTNTKHPFIVILKHPAISPFPFPTHPSSSSCFIHPSLHPTLTTKPAPPLTKNRLTPQELNLPLIRKFGGKISNLS